MTRYFLKKSFFLSFLGHLAVFSLFSVSVGYKIPQLKHTDVSCWGAFFDPKQVYFRLPSVGRQTQLQGSFESLSKAKLDTSLGKTTAEKEVYRYNIGIDCRFKPAAVISRQEQRPQIAYKTLVTAVPVVRSTPAIMLYPNLPPHFLLYFRDRQRVHIELAFNIRRANKANVIALKRKISSGSLEADLLSMRYISHYLFIQQAYFVSDKWQSVKIDLSTKDK